MSSPFSLLFNTPTSTQPHKPNKKTKPRPHKNPQRGMGVERLERLRLQELQKTTQHHHLNLYNNPFNLNKDPLPVPVPVPEQCYPVHYGLPINMYGNCGGGFLGWDQNNGFNGRVVGSGQHDHISNVKELSSVPNVFVSNMHHHHSSYCDLCFKKKMVMMNGDQNLGHKQRKSNFSPQISPPNPPNFLGLNMDNNIDFNTNNTTGSFNTSRPARNASHTNHNTTTKGKDVVAVHRKGNTCRGGGSVLMEYEFFPRSKTSEINYGTITSTASKEWEILGSSETKVAVGSSVGGGEASSCVTVCDYSTPHTSNSIDLSLRLSC